MSTNGWGKGSVNNTNGWGAGAINNDIGWGDSQLRSWSGDTDIDGGTGIPVNTVAPVISGTTTLGSVLTTTNGTWTAKPAATFTYQWKRNGSNIIGATNSTYTLVNDDGATNITCQVTATNDFGSASATSNTLAVPAFTDADAQAFITAAAITNPTQQTAINQLVTDLKGYGIWSKMKAVYPFVGGTASSHKFNLKDPRDLDAAYRLVFNGGGTHSANGYQPNGVNAFADAFITNSAMSYTSTHLSTYSRTDANNSGIAMGNTTNQYCMFYTRNSGNFQMGINAAAFNSVANANSLGHYIATRTASNAQKGYKNGLAITTSTNAVVNDNTKMYIGAAFRTGVGALGYDNRQTAFASIGDGLTDTEAANFYTAVQTFQVTLGRSIGTQTVSDADAQAFVTNAGIVDQVEANAVNNLVIGLKADGLWSKMKAIYPFVGGTASTHKFNLKNPLDTDAAFRLVFNGGWTHSSTGALPNGTNGWANTFLNEQNTLAINNAHLSIYSRTNADGLFCDIGIISGSNESNIFSKYNNVFYPRIQSTNNGISNTISSLGLFLSNRISSTEIRAFQNNVLKQITNNSITKVNASVYIGSAFFNGGNSLYSPRQYAFASIGDGLTDTEAANFYTAVQAFQTSLNRQV